MCDLCVWFLMFSITSDFICCSLYQSFVPFLWLSPLCVHNILFIHSHTISNFCCFLSSRVLRSLKLGNGLFCIFRKKQLVKEMKTAQGVIL